MDIKKLSGNSGQLFYLFAVRYLISKQDQTLGLNSFARPKCTEINSCRKVFSFKGVRIVSCTLCLVCKSNNFFSKRIGNHKYNMRIRRNEITDLSLPREWIRISFEPKPIFRIF